jgi:hypothetical protein
MGTTSRAAAFVHQYGHFRRPDGFCISQRSPAGAWVLAAHTIYAAARSPHGTTSDRPIHQTNPQKKLSDIVNLLKRFGIFKKYNVSNDVTKNVWFPSNLICLPGNGP